MLQLTKALVLMLVIFVLACAHGIAQERPADKPSDERAPRVSQTSRGEGDNKQGAAANENSASAAHGHSAAIGDEIGDARRLENPVAAASWENAAISRLELSPETDADQLRKSWALGADFGRRVNPARTPPPGSSVVDDDDPVNPPASEKFHWKPAVYQSLVAQGFQHGYALIFQEKTRRALKGPFFRDYWESVKAVRGWSDDNKFFTNYIAHPMQGSFTGYIFVQNHDRAKKQQFNESPQYWKDRLKAMAWSAAWSTNWELGPISQSTIGNVGLYGRQGWVDLVVTPTVGTAWMITEEAIDRYIIRHHDSKSLMRRIILRSFLNPTRSVANVFRFKVPWHRDHRH